MIPIGVMEGGKLAVFLHSQNVETGNADSFRCKIISLFHAQSIARIQETVAGFATFRGCGGSR